MRTPLLAKDAVKRQWFIIDAKGQTLGRLSTRVAAVLIGKHKPDFTPHADCGDFVIVVNASQVHLTGKKWTDKLYQHHTQYPGGLLTQTAGDIRAKHPERLIELAVRGMLPLNKLRALRMKRLRVFAGAEHEHGAHKPQPLPQPIKVD
jgi:large subunit ribosomal protein L13